MQALKVHDTELRYEITQLLIDAGAQGKCVGEALVEVVQSLVAAHGQYDGHHPAEDMDTKLFTLFARQRAG